MPVLRILCYNCSVVNWTVVSLTAAKFKPLIFYVWLRLVLCCEHVHSHDFVWLLLVACTILLNTYNRTYTEGWKPCSSQCYHSIISSVLQMNFSKSGLRLSEMWLWSLLSSRMCSLVNVWRCRGFSKKVPPKRLNTSARGCQIPEDGYISFPNKLPHQNSVCIYVLTYRTQMSNPV
jgi:hypothetical protein